MHGCFPVSKPTSFIRFVLALQVKAKELIAMAERYGKRLAAGEGASDADKDSFDVRTVLVFSRTIQVPQVSLMLLSLSL